MVLLISDQLKERTYVQCLISCLQGQFQINHMQRMCKLGRRSRAKALCSAISFFSQESKDNSCFSCVVIVLLWLELLFIEGSPAMVYGVDLLFMG